MIRNKLHTVNKWNKPAFMQENVFDGLTMPTNQMQIGEGLFNYNLSTPTVTPKINWGNATQRNMALGQTKALTSSFGSGNPINLQQSNQMLSNTISGSGGSDRGSGANTGKGSSPFIMLANAAAPMIGSLMGQGYQTGAGNAIGSLGSTVGSAVSTVDPVLGLGINLGSQVIGGAVNGLFGEKVNEKALAQANAGTNYLGSFISDAGSYDDLEGIQDQAMVDDPYSGGIFNSSAKRKNAKLKRERENALSWAERSVENNIDNIWNDQMNNYLANYSAEGGKIEIKHPGRLTELKKRTGKTEAELWAEGKPEVRKMITFSRNARKWKKAYGGYIEAANNLFALGGPDDPPVGTTNEDLENLMFYLSQKEKYPNGRKKTEAEKFLNYRLGIPERKTAPWFEETPTYIPESPSEHLDRVLDVTSKIVKGIGRQTKKTTSKGEPYIPHVKFALGGDIQTNSADFSTGLTHIDAGGSHESNPYEGIQIGKDESGTPNLVEEGERIFNDYVYSKRIFVDGGTLEKFHLSKKRKISFADLAELLEKESAERPNDPISLAGLKSKMESLANEQERQKAEMEAEEARQAFEALSPEEQVAVMQQATQDERASAQQEQAAQKMAMQEAGAVPQPTEPSEEEILMAQQQAMADGSEADLGQEVPVMAEGGKINRFDGGGWKNRSSSFENAIKWAREKGFGPNDAQYIAKALMQVINKDPEKYVRHEVRMFGKSDPPYIHYGDVYDSMIPTLTNTKEKWFNEWVRLGVPRNLAFGITHRMPSRYDTKGLREREQAYNRLVRNYTTPSSASRSTSIKTSAYSSIPFGNTGFTSKSSLERPAEETIVPAQVTQDAPVQGSSVAKATVQPETPPPTPVTVIPRGTTAPVVTTGNNPVSDSRVSADSVTGKPYDWYRNGSDGYSTPTGFTVGDNGLIDKETGYTQEYRDLVGKLTADDIRKWAAEHPQDPSLLSFLARGNRLEDLTTDQWRKGATDGKYGFMHHVADSLLNSPVADHNNEVTINTEPRVFHAMDGDDYDGYIEGALGPEVGAEVRRETLPNGDTVIYHTKTSSSTDATPQDTVAANGERKIRPVYRNENLRYAGLFGPAVGLGMQMAGIGRPDTSGIDAAVNSGRGLALAKYKPLGNYMTYRPMDIWYEQNRLNANTRATDRAITNNASPTSTRMAGLLASEYNNQIGSGNLYRQALEYNDAQRARVAEFNRGTDQFNADAYNRTSQFNADARNRARQYNAQLQMQAAGQKMAADQAWNQGIYGNVAGLFRGIGDLGTENYRHNRIADMAATGIFGTMKPETFVSNGFLRYETDEERRRRLSGNMSAKGGKMTKKKKGLTF